MPSVRGQIPPSRSEDARGTSPEAVLDIMRGANRIERFQLGSNRSPFRDSFSAASLSLFKIRADRESRSREARPMKRCAVSRSVDINEGAV